MNINSTSPRPARARRALACALTRIAAGDLILRILGERPRIALLTAMAFLSFTARAQLLQPEVLVNFQSDRPSGPVGNLIQDSDGSFYGFTGGGGALGTGTLFKLTTNGAWTTLASLNERLEPFARILSGPILGGNGIFYGTSSGGGGNDLGRVFQVATNGAVTTLVSFNGSNGSRPQAGLTLGSDGNFYGTTSDGGGNGAGTVFRMTTNGTLITLISFTDYLSPSGLTQGRDGNFYGTTSSGGTDGYGTVFKVTTNGALSTLVSFNLTNGAFPKTGVTLGDDGHFYGTTWRGGSDFFGTVFRVTTNGVLTTLVSFNENNGADPYTVVSARDGRLYGTTSGGGSGGNGTVFRLTTSGVLTTLVSFTNANGAVPNGLTLGTDDQLYGTTSQGGIAQAGTAFRIASNGTLTWSVSFGQFLGAQPRAGVTQGRDGNFYGTTTEGGSSFVDGTVFKVTTNGTLTTLVSFDGANGSQPRASLTLGRDGHFYGMTYAGGQNGLGTVFKVTTNGTLTTLVSFNGNPSSGLNPQAELALDSAGHFYGTTAYTVFRMTTNGTLTWVVPLDRFITGIVPKAGLALGNDGHFYGTTSLYGRSDGLGSGTVFRVTTNGTLTTLVSFNGTNGSTPTARLTLGNDGYFYGTTFGTSGTIGDNGTVFRLRVPNAFPIVTTIQPANQTLLSGTTATFDASAIGAEPLSYSWRKNGVPLTEAGIISGASTRTLTLSNVASADAGAYSVLVSNGLGVAVSSNSTLTVLGTVPLAEALDATNLVWSIEAGVGWHGQSATRHDGVDAGQSGPIPMGIVRSRLVTTVAGPGTLTFWWKHSHPGGAASGNLTFRDNAVGSSSGNVDWQQRSFSLSAGNHRLEWEHYSFDANGRAWLDQVAYVPIVAPIIVTAPQSQTNMAGDNVTFTVIVTNNATLPVGYQWRKGGMVLTNFLLSNRTSSFTLFNVATNVTSTGGPGSYHVVVTNAGSPSPGIASGVANLTVWPATAPSVVTLSASEVTTNGALLNASVNPMGAFTTGWFDYGLTAAYGSRTSATNLGNAAASIPFAHLAGGLLPGTNYHYRVVATNHGGMAVGQDMTFETAPLSSRPVIHGFTRFPNGQFRLQCTAITGAAYTVIVSTNLMDWTPLGPAAETAPGQFEFTDADAPAHPTRFYQLRSP